jgi:hypothetical protein
MLPHQRAILENPPALYTCNARVQKGRDEQRLLVEEHMVWQFVAVISRAGEVLTLVGSQWCWGKRKQVQFAADLGIAVCARVYRPLPMWM